MLFLIASCSLPSFLFFLEKILLYLLALQGVGPAGPFLQQPSSSTKPASAPLTRNVVGSGSSSGGGRWSSASDQRDVLITEQLALIKSLNDTISKHKQVGIDIVEVAFLNEILLFCCLICT